MTNRTRTPNDFTWDIQINFSEVMKIISMHTCMAYIVVQLFLLSLQGVDTIIND